MPIPDRLGEYRYGDFLLDEEGAVVARFDGEYHTARENLAIARRIAAAWNALRGVSTEAIEAVANQPTDEARMNALARVPFAADQAPAPTERGETTP